MNDAVPTTVTMDERKRLVLPDPKGRKGDVFQVQIEDEDHFHLVRLKPGDKGRKKAKLIKLKDGSYVGVGVRPTSTLEIRQLIEEQWP